MKINSRSSSPPASSLQHPAFIIVGPTSVGKSALALELSRHLDAEIVGVDAFQLYRELPILTAQTSPQEIPQHLVAVLSPTEECDAMRYRSMALPILDEIVARKKTALLVGGTGFYLRALLSPLDPLPSANADVRAQLAKASHKELLLQLQQLDPEAPSQIDLNNRRRVERALEILLLTKKPLAEIWKKEKASAIPHRGIFLTRDREDLHHRIEKNVKAMFDQGVITEVAALARIFHGSHSEAKEKADETRRRQSFDQGCMSPYCSDQNSTTTQYSSALAKLQTERHEISGLDHVALSHTASMTLGLREIQAHLRGELSLTETIATIIQKTKRYAKRQMTWFRNQHDFPQLNLSRFSSLEGAATEAAMELLGEKSKNNSLFP